MPEIRAVMFDVGGVLVNDVDQLLYKKLNEIFNRKTEEVIKAIHVIEPQFQKGEINEAEFWKIVFEVLNVELDPRGMVGKWGGMYEKIVRVDEGTTELANRLRHAGYVTGIISNTEKPHVDVMRRMGLFDGFEPVILSCEVGLRKPGREIFQLALDRLGVPASQVAYTDDNERKMSGAKEIGINCCIFDGTKGLADRLKRMGLDF